MIAKKDTLKNWIIKTGTASVGKCLILGMFDPEIPAELRNSLSAESKRPAQKNK